MMENGYIGRKKEGPGIQTMIPTFGTVGEIQTCTIDILQEVVVHSCSGVGEKTKPYNLVLGRYQ